jgi:hypothetical protein
MPRLFNSILLLLVLLSNKSYSVEIEGLKLENGQGEKLLAAPEGARDPAGTLVFASNSQNEILKIRLKKNLDIKSANAILNQKIIQLNSLYRPASVPYAGAITNSIDCSKKYNLSQMPVESKDALSVRFKLKANEQLVYGVCEEKKLDYKSEYVLIYCKKNKNFYEVKYYINKKNKKEFELITECI